MPETLSAKTRYLLRQYRLRPSKRLGQSFLVDESVRELILKEAMIEPGDAVVEIGPGFGVLTEGLAKRAAFVLAVELDERLCCMLMEAFKEKPQVCILHGDALKCDFEAHLRERKEGKAKVVANIPYSITTPLLIKLVSLRQLFSYILVMVQREVACRIMAPPGVKDYGSFSIFLRYHTDPQILAYISRDAFYPRPDVDSTLIRLDIRESPPIKVQDEALFFKLVRAAFSQRRKTIRNALLAHRSLVSDPWRLDMALAEAGIFPHRRGETLGLEEFGRLYTSLFQYKNG